jgi:ketosteroid isomerase-like protein
MSNENGELIRRAYAAYSQGRPGDDAPVRRSRSGVDLPRSQPRGPEPQVCHGRHELATALERQAERGLKAELEEVVARGDRVMVVVRTPGVDMFRARKADDRNNAVLTVREGRI